MKEGKNYEKTQKKNIENLDTVERGILVDVKHNAPSANSGATKSKKLGIKNILLVLVLLIVISTISMYAWAKYQSSFKGSATSEIAKWTFNVKDGNTETIDILDFPITRTDENEKVARDNIAPGTYGEFQIEIDARGTETILTYVIDINFTNKPKNLKFYLDKDMIYELDVENDTLKLSDFLSLDDVKDIVTRKIYWKWELETGNTEEEIYNNDLLDSEYIGKRLQMSISVTGEQVLNAKSDKDYIIAYSGNGATSGSVYADAIVSSENKIIKNNNFERKYTVNLDANGGIVEKSSVTSEYKFSHWSLDGRNKDVLFYSDKEINNQNTSYSSKGREFIWYTDIAPYVDSYGVGEYYLCFDLKSEDVSKYNVILVYCQNGSISRYQLCKSKDLTPNFDVIVQEEYKQFELNTIVRTYRLTETKAMLAFYGAYGTGNYPVVKNVNFDVGKGYKELQSIDYNEIEQKLDNNVLKLYAKWIPQQVTLPIPTREGYTFKGWYTSANGGEKVSNTLTPTSNVTYYAQWEAE